MKREQLKDLGLTDEQIDSVMAEHGKDLNALQGQVTSLTGERDSLQKQVTDSGDTINQLKKSAKGNEDAQKAISDYEAQLKQSQTDYANLQKTTAIDLALRDAGALNSKAAAALLDGSKISFEDGKLSGLNDQLSQVKADNSFLFKSDKPAAPEQKPNTPPITTGGNPDPDNNKPLDPATASYEQLAAQYEATQN